MEALTTKTVTIASSGTTSTALELTARECVVAFQTASSTFDGTAMALHASLDGGTTYSPVYDVYGNAVSFTIGDDVSGGRTYFVAPEITYGLPKVKFVSNANQGGNETIQVSVRSGSD